MIALDAVDLSGFNIRQAGLFASVAERGIATPKEILYMIPSKARESDEELRRTVHQIYAMFQMFGVRVVPNSVKKLLRQRESASRPTSPPGDVPRGALDAFKLEIQRAAKLEDDEIAECAQAIKAGNQTARLRVLGATLREVLTVAYGWYTDQIIGETGFHVLDLAQEGALGVWIKLPEFSGTTRKELHEFALESAKDGIKEALASAGLTVALNKEVASLLRKVNRVWIAWVKEHKKDPHPYEIAELIGVPGLRVADLLNTTRISVRPTRSLEAPIVGRGGDEVGTLHDLIPDTRPTPEEELMERQAQELQQQLQDALEVAFKKLTPMEQYVLALRFGSQGGDRHTRVQIAELLGTYERMVLDIETEALAKLRADRKIGECKIAIDGRPRVTTVKFTLPRSLSNAGDDAEEAQFVIHRHAWEEAELPEALIKEEARNNRRVRGHFVREGLIPARAWYRKIKE